MPRAWPGFPVTLNSLNRSVSELTTNGGHAESEDMHAIRVAEEGLLSELESGPMQPRALRDRVIKRADSREDVSLAFWRLLNRGEIVLTENRTVQLAA